jgi:hypothetical protein
MTEDEAEANFRRWFGNSRIADEAGAPLAVYHATRTTFDAFQPQRHADTGFHFGTRAQASMRGGAVLLEVYLSAERLKRVKDHGKWTRQQIATARREGYNGIVYLNRYEGIPTERILALEANGLLRKLDTLSDREFRRAVPEAEDSFIVFEPTQVKAISNPGTWSRMDPRLNDEGPIEEELEVVPGRGMT